jgi:hypothetical protein
MQSVKLTSSDLEVDERKTLKLVSNKKDVAFRTELIWCIIWASDGLLWIREGTIGFRKGGEISWVAEDSMIFKNGSFQGFRIIQRNVSTEAAPFWIF